MRLAPLVIVALMACAPPLLAQTPDANGNLAAPQASRPPEPEMRRRRRRPETAPPVPAKPPQARPPPSGRFAFSRVETGFLRLDTQTGQVALCSARTRRLGLRGGAGRARRAGEGNRAAAGRSHRAEARARGLADRRRPRGRRRRCPTPATKKTPLLTDEDIARARAYVEEAWRRLVEMLMNFQKDVMRKT